ncbi:hypothetical protein NUW54_g2628 [Trametes sanguinea]|uniref:Uncharacterized protein n=1 Tax=Trametes sanguinea TaxID=158606 RepID=A0ACC1Q388_9APHY|nr:hypothetical protein NUW54_g2628 [Trametes sanguinea]
MQERHRRAIMGKQSASTSKSNQSHPTYKSSSSSEIDDSPESDPEPPKSLSVAWTTALPPGIRRMSVSEAILVDSLVVLSGGCGCGGTGVEGLTSMDGTMANDVSLTLYCFTVISPALGAGHTDGVGGQRW